MNSITETAQNSTLDVVQKIESASSGDYQVKDFVFNDREFLGVCTSTSIARVTVYVNDPNRLNATSVGRLACIQSVDNEWIIGRVEDVVTNKRKPDQKLTFTLHVCLIGTLILNSQKNTSRFSRSLVHAAKIDFHCYVLEGAKLSFFMSGISAGNSASDLPLGHYVMDKSVTAYIDGNKLFRRHLAILGNSGCGKSWTVSALIEKIARMPSASIIVLDIHGEYQGLPYASQYRIAGPGDSGLASESILFFPLWFLSFEELCTFLMDPSDPDASTQMMILSTVIRKRKLHYLNENGKKDLVKSFTVDSPIPFKITDLLYDLHYLNSEMVSGTNQGEVIKGPYFGKMDRFIPRLESLVNDKRYGFLFEDSTQTYDYAYINSVMGRLLATGMHGKQHRGIRIIDLSMTPSDLLPVIIGCLGRFLFQAQFWNIPENRHPLNLVCDEAHLYLPNLDQVSAAQRNTLFQFGRIAKEGRKYGLTLTVISQRPSDLNTSILSQCANIMTLAISNIIDQQIVKKYMPDGMSNLIEELPLLGIGEAIVIGEASLLPLKIAVTPPESPPIGETYNYCDVWNLKEIHKDQLKGIENMRRQMRI